MPVHLGVSRFDSADDDLQGLAGQRVKLLRQLEDLIGFHLLLLSYINEPNEDPEKQAVTSFGDREDLHPAEENTVTLQAFACGALIQTDLYYCQKKKIK